MFTKKQLVDFWVKQGFDYKEIEEKKVSEIIDLLSEKRREGLLKEEEKQLDQYEAKELRIVKQSIVKSLIESGKIDGYSEEIENTLINPWIEYVYRNTTKDYNLIKKTNDLPF